MIGEGEDYSISVLMVDVDHFKKINDTYGHQGGDQVLETVAQKLKSTCRKSDILCRYGGEEFLIILPGADITDSKVVGEKLRNAIEHTSLKFENKTIKATISIGAAQIKVGMEKPEQAIARADRALYHSKENGRNRVSVNIDGKII
jgi:diguanylate cyclase (GGDEF)-like protein